MIIEIQDKQGNKSSFEVDGSFDAMHSEQNLKPIEHYVNEFSEPVWVYLNILSWHIL